MRKLLALVLLACSTLAWGQAFPAKPIRLILPFAAGSPSDLIARGVGA